MSCRPDVEEGSPESRSVNLKMSDNLIKLTVQDAQHE